MMKHKITIPISDKNSKLIIEFQDFQNKPNPTPSIAYTLTLLGSDSVGKSALCKRWKESTFYPVLESTIGAAYHFKDVIIEDHTTVTVQVWDTAGHERFDSLCPIYFSASQGIILIYDISQERTWRKVKYWVSQIKDNCSDLKKVVIFVVANKMDLYLDQLQTTQKQAALSKMAQEFSSFTGKCDSINTNSSIASDPESPKLWRWDALELGNDFVSMKEVLEFIREEGIEHWVPVSSKLGLNVNELFVAVAQTINHQNITALEEQNDSIDDLSIKFGSVESSGGLETSLDEEVYREEGVGQAVWQPDHTASECGRCGSKFSLVRRKHHCRKCGKIFCSKCTSRKAYIPGPLDREKYRVCDDCFYLLGGS